MNTYSFSLSGMDIDAASERLSAFLESIGVEHLNVLRISLSIEELLLRWRDVFGEKKAFTLVTNISWSRTRISIHLSGKEFDPTAPAETDEDEAEFNPELPLVAIGLFPQYSYRNGVNRLTLDLPRPYKYPVLNVLSPLLVGLVLGLLGRIILPGAVRDFVTGTLVDPIREAFYRLMNAVASPVIFLSILWSICGTGNALKIAKASRKTILSFLTACIAFGVQALLLGTLLFGLRPTLGASVRAEIYSIVTTIFDLVPDNIFTPTITSRAEQLIILGFIIGNMLLAIGSKTHRLIELVDEANNLGNLAVEWVCRVTPGFVAMMVTVELWGTADQALLRLLPPAAAFLVTMLAFVLIDVAWTSFRHHVPFPVLVKKLTPSYWIAMRNASVSASYGASESCCTRKLGIPAELASYALPRGLTIYVPASIFEMALFALYIAKTDGMAVSSSWLLKALIMVVGVSVATPPVTGIGVLNFLCLLTALNISHEVLTAFLVIDTLMSFFIPPVNQLLLQLHLVHDAKRQGVLNIKVLQSE